MLGGAIVAYAFAPEFVYTVLELRHSLGVCVGVLVLGDSEVDLAEYLGYVAQLGLGALWGYWPCVELEVPACLGCYTDFSGGVYEVEGWKLLLGDEEMGQKVGVLDEGVSPHLGCLVDSGLELLCCEELEVCGHL